MISKNHEDKLLLSGAAYAEPFELKKSSGVLDEDTIVRLPLFTKNYHSFCLCESVSVCVCFCLYLSVVPMFSLNARCWCCKNMIVVLAVCESWLASYLLWGFSTTISKVQAGHPLLDVKWHLCQEERKKIGMRRKTMKSSDPEKPGSSRQASMEGC